MMNSPTHSKPPPSCNDSSNEHPVKDESIDEAIMTTESNSSKNEVKHTESCGYTPLSDPSVVASSPMWCVGPTCDDDEDDDDDDDWESSYQPVNATTSSDEDDNNGVLLQSSLNNKPLVVADYAAVASQALSLIEIDYAATLRQERVKEPAVDNLAETTEVIRKSPLLFATGSEMEEESDETSKEGQITTDEKQGLSDDLHNPSVSYPSVSSPSLSTADNRNDPAGSVDCQAVARAVATIQLRQPKLNQALSTWQAQQKHHHIIPPAPHAAFSKRTRKARAASANLSRSATIAEALVRIIQPQNKNIDPNICLHIIGCDHVECGSSDRVRAFFTPLARWLSVRTQTRVLCLRLIGPGIPSSTDGTTVPLLPDQNMLFRASLHSVMYDEFLEAHDETADLVVAFNAGVWGYSDWLQTLRVVARRGRSIPVVITAYTLQEAEDDYEILRQIVAGTVAEDVPDERVLWKPQLNPFSSRIERPTTNALAGRVYHENQAWQAWSL